MESSLLPGKAILFGEHAVVYPGHTAVILPVRGVSCQASVVSSVASSDDYLEVIIGIASDYLRSKNIVDKRPALEIKSTIPIGGMGSSAAAAAAAIQAYMRYHDLTLSRDEWYELTLTAERYKHGRPSGTDVAAVIHGQPVILHKDQTGKNTITVASEIPDQLLKHSYVLHTGQPKQSTGDMITYVSNNKQRSQPIIEAIEANTQAFLSKLPDELSFIRHINTAGALLEDLGVVTDLGQSLTRQIRAGGGAGKVSGAGGLGTGACGALFVYLNNSELLRKLMRSYKVYPMLQGKSGE